MFTRSRSLTALLALALAGCGSLPTHGVTTKAGALAAQAVGSGNRVSAGTMAGMVADAFDRADADRDGLLSGKESGLTAAQFHVLDRDGDGVLSRAEWTYDLPESQVTAALGAFQPQVDATFAALDTDHDGVVSAAEARAAAPVGATVGGAPEPLKAAVVLGALRGADADGDGAISRGEFPRFYVQLSQDGTGRGWFGSIAQVLLGGYLAVTSRLAEHIAMHPTRIPLRSTPAKWGLPFEQVSFKTADGLTLKGWYIPAATPTDETVIEVHGIDDNRDNFVRQGQIYMLHDRYNQLAFDLRDQGESEGHITSFGLNEGKDVLAAKAYLATRGQTRVAAYGISLGAAGVIRAAAVDPTILGVVDDCAFTTVRSAFAGFISLTFIPCPELIAAATLARANEELGADMTTAEPISQVRAIAPRPFLVIHGAVDPNIPVEDSQLNYEAAGSGLHKELWIVPKGGHAASAVAQPEQYKQHLLAHLALAFAQPAALTLKFGPALK